MVLPNTSNHNSAGGFTFIELLIVLALIAMALAFALTTDLRDYFSTTFRTERDVIVGTLHTARSRAASNICEGPCTDGKPHGVYFGSPGEYILFQGSSWAARDTAYDEPIPAQNKTVSVGGATSVVFSRLRAQPTLTGGSNIVLTDMNGKSSVITIEPEGRVWWTN